MLRQNHLFRAALTAIGLLLLLGAPAQAEPSGTLVFQTPDLCTLLAPGAKSVTPIMRGCTGKYATGKLRGLSQPQEILATADVFQDLSPADAQSMADCSNVRNDPVSSKKCTPLQLGDKSYEISYDPPSPRYLARLARSCYYAAVALETYTDTWGTKVDQDLVNRGRELLRQIDEKLKAAPPCTGAPTPLPGRLNVGIGGNYDEANELVEVSATVESRPNVGIGDDFYEWTLDGAPIQKGKELKSIQYDTSALAAGEHEIVVKVTDIPNNLGGGATFKFTVKRTTAPNPPPPPAAKPQIQIITPAGAQTLDPTTKTPVTLPSGKAELRARCDAAVYGLLTYLLYKEGDDLETLVMRGKALMLAILVQAHCDKLLAVHPGATTGVLARPLAVPAAQEAAADIALELQQGAGEFEITHPRAALHFETATARMDAFGKQRLVVGYDPDTQTTLVRALDGPVTVTLKNNASSRVTLTAGQQVVVKGNTLGPVSAAPPNAKPAGQAQIVVNALDNDPENKLWNCETNRVPFGNEEVDRSRCFTFRYQVPAGGITSAIMNVSLNTLGSLQETDATAIAVGQPYPPCEWGYGGMPGCVVVHGGFEGKHQSLSVNLLDIACDASVQGSPEAQALVRDQLQTGVVHMILEDDTAVYGAQLILNGGPPSITCGASENPMETLPPSTGDTGSGTSAGTTNPSGGDTGSGTGAGTTNPPGGDTGSSGAAGGSVVPGTTLPLPPFGSSEPNSSVTGMTLQVAQRRVAPGELVMVPVWLLNGRGVANMNFDLTYDPRVARPEGTISKGNLLDIALLSTNANTAGVIHLGLAQDVNLNGTGTLAYLAFRAYGNPGDRTTLMPRVTTINSQEGSSLSIDRIPGEIVIVGPDEKLQGDCDSDGTITSVDALCALEMSVQLRPALTILDVDNNGNVTSRDAAILLQRALEIRR